ncbi:Spo0E family sporulation regulatory protein-aspartic acid phosphatase [Orenia metallireducens]|uniref:Spo0E family sporulation regulatory protein-aspartic acid phosphatase n=1 Tax=Orenia metallireducens TaxID=1413210 RepID=UPI0009F345D3|nr:Spo0E family sporulation regulatory protein-aspartic acid phosphatase [Orenia metallireducens]
MEHINSQIKILRRLLKAKVKEKNNNFLDPEIQKISQKLDDLLVSLLKDRF